MIWLQSASSQAMTIAFGVCQFGRFFFALFRFVFANGFLPLGFSVDVSLHFLGPRNVRETHRNLFNNTIATYHICYTNLYKPHSTNHTSLRFFVFVVLQATVDKSHVLTFLCTFFVPDNVRES